MMAYKFLNEFQGADALLPTQRGKLLYFCMQKQSQNLINAFRNKVLMSHFKVGKLNAQQSKNFNTVMYN